MKKFLVILFFVFVQFFPAFAKSPQTDYLIIPDIALYKSIGFEPIINKSYDLTDLGYGVARLEGTIWNDTSWARTVIVGHTPGAFEELKRLDIGAKIIVLTETQELEYIVFDIRVVSPSDDSWLMPTDQHELTLITCHDNEQTRLVVRAKI